MLPKEKYPIQSKSKKTICLGIHVAKENARNPTWTVDKMEIRKIYILVKVSMKSKRLDNLHGEGELRKFKGSKKRQ